MINSEKTINKHMKSSIENIDLKIILGLSLMILLGKFLLISFTMVIDDEAYYWFWGQYLALGYVEHGPFVAYFVRFFTFLLGDNGFGVRVGGVFGYFLLGIFLYRFGRDWQHQSKPEENQSQKYFSSSHLPLIFTNLFWLLPFYFIFSVVLTTDTPMILFLFLSVGYYYKGFFYHKKYLYIAGMLLGIAFLAKIASLFVALGIFGYVVFSRRRLEWLASKELWISFFLIALFYSPQVIWNAQNDFAFLTYAANVLDKKGSFHHWLELWIAQVLIYGPIFFGLGLYLLVKVMWNYIHAGKINLERRKDASMIEKKFYFAMTSLVGFIYLCYKSGTNKLEANWPAFAFVGIFYLVAMYFLENWHRFAVRFAYYGQQGLALAFVSILLLQSTEKGILPLPLHLDITSRYYQYTVLTDEFKSYYDASMKKDRHILSSSYQLPSMINLYLKPKKDAICISRGNYHETMYSFIYPDEVLIGKDFYVLLRSKGDKLLRCFEEVNKLREFIPMRAGRKLPGRVYYLYEAKGYRGRENFKR